MNGKKQFSILIVDDSGANLRLLAGILRADYNVHIAKNGFDAIQAAVEKRPDVILLDILMPNIDGYEVITVLKNDERTREIPVVFITALDGQGDEEKGLSLQAADYISKPFTPAIVKLRVRNQIRIVSQLRDIKDMQYHELMANVLNGLDAFIAVVDDNYRILFLSGAAKGYYGIEGDCTGQLCYDVIQELSAPCEGCPNQELSERPDDTIVWEHRDAAKGGVLRKTTKLIDWADGKKARLEYAMNLSGAVKLDKNSLPAEAVDKKLYSDPLTEIYNRQFFEEYIKSVLGHLACSGGVLSLMRIDIDCFEMYNAAYGRPKGDACLKRAAGALKGCVMREGDFVARYGGGEFVAVLPNVDKYGARLVARKMLHAIRDLRIPHEKNDVAECVSVSIGVAAGRVQPAHSRDDYIKLAGDMLLQSKNGGRNRFTLAILP